MFILEDQGGSLVRPQVENDPKLKICWNVYP